MVPHRDACGETAKRLPGDSRQRSFHRLCSLVPPFSQLMTDAAAPAEAQSADGTAGEAVRFHVLWCCVKTSTVAV